jgi:hypothetical protein
MAEIAARVRKETEVSMGQIAMKLGIGLDKQYKLALAFRDVYPGIELKKGIWRLNGRE